MRRSLTVGALTLAILTAGAAPALADPGDRRARPPIPSCPPGVFTSEEDRSEEARTPRTGPINQFTKGQEDCPNV